MGSRTRSERPRALLALGIAVTLYGILIGTFRLVAWPRPDWQSTVLALLPVPELWLAVGGLVISRHLAARGDAVPAVRRIGSAITAFFLGILAAWNVGEIIYRWNYRDHFILRDDLMLLPSLLTMLTRVEWFRTVVGSGMVYLASAVLLLVLGTGLLQSTRKAVDAVWGGMAPDNRSLAIGILLILCGMAQAAVFPKETPTLLFAAGFTEQSIPMSDPVAAVPVEGMAMDAPPVSSVPELPDLSAEELEAARTAFEELENTRTFSYSGIADGDIHLLIIESYGHTLFTNPVHRENIAPVFDDISNRMEELGWSAASGFLHSPAYGGRSWLADATILTGRRMTDQRVFDQHIYRDDPHLIGQMNAAGYRTVYAAPGTRRTPDDWKAFYGFDDYLIEGDFGWNGPFISFGEMSDQYLLDVVGRRYVDSEEPVFLSALMVSSHVPFVRIPEYIEDWSRLGDGSLYNSEGIRRFNNNWLTGSEYPEGYVYSMSYVFDTILGYMERYVDDDALVVIVGDHQPRNRGPHPRFGRRPDPFCQPGCRRPGRPGSRSLQLHIPAGRRGAPAADGAVPVTAESGSSARGLPESLSGSRKRMICIDPV